MNLNTELSDSREYLKSLLANRSELLKGDEDGYYDVEDLDYLDGQIMLTEEDIEGLVAETAAANYNILRFDAYWQNLNPMATA